MEIVNKVNTLLIIQLNAKSVIVENIYYKAQINVKRAIPLAKSVKDHIYAHLAIILIISRKINVYLAKKIV